MISWTDVDRRLEESLLPHHHVISYTCTHTHTVIEEEKVAVSYVTLILDLNLIQIQNSGSVQTELVFFRNFIDLIRTLRKTAEQDVNI